CATLVRDGEETLSQSALWISEKSGQEDSEVSVPETLLSEVARLSDLTNILGTPNAAMLRDWYMPLLHGTTDERWNNIFLGERARDLALHKNQTLKRSTFWTITDDRPASKIIDDVAEALGWKPGILDEEEEDAIDLNALAEVASPQPGLKTENGVDKLTVTNNSEVDQVVAQAQLENLPFDQAELCQTMIDQLPGNAPPSVGVNLDAYRRNLLKGPLALSTRLVAQYGDAFIAEFDDPHSDVWSTGTKSLRVSWNSNHKEILQHYPLAKKADEIIAPLPFDEAAATGDALSKPISDVNEAVKALHEIELTDDDFAEFFGQAAADADNFSVAWPSVDPSDKPVTGSITPKKRYAAATLGFMSKLLNTLDSAVSLSNTPQGQAVIKAVREAIAALRVFFGI
ncbi:MAG: hypothetical protein AAGI92_11385, partial [Pseudomonadota bacterium]